MNSNPIMVYITITLLSGLLCSSLGVPVIPYDTLLRPGSYIFNQEGVDSYRALVYDGDEIVIGAKNNIFVFNRTTLVKIDELELHPSPTDIRIDETGKFVIAAGQRADDIKGCDPSKQPDCKVIINQLHIYGRRLYIFGITSHVPFYQQRPWKNFKAVQIPQVTMSGRLLSLPTSPQEPVASVVVKDRFFIGSAFYNDQKDVAIMAAKLTNHRTEPIRTKKDDSWLKSPEFVGAFEEGKAVYFVFRELALEASAGYAKPPMYSRVGRICKNDYGAKDPSAARFFVSFKKARLLCGGHDIVIATSYNVRQRALYASFVDKSFKSIALCLYALPEIERAFAGRFHHRDGTGKWKDVLETDPTTAKKVVNTCFGPRALDDAMKYHLMTNPVFPFCGYPHYVKRGSEQDFFHAIGSSARRLEAYMADSMSRVWNFSISTCAAHPQEAWQLPPQISVNAIYTRDNSILMLTNINIISIPLPRI